MVSKDSLDNPTWDHTFEVEVNSSNLSDILTLTLLENRLIKDDIIGSFSQPARTLKDKRGKQYWITLYDKKIKRSDILLEPKFVPYIKSV